MKNLLTLFGIGQIKFGASWASLIACILYFDCIYFFENYSYLNGVVFLVVLILSLRQLKILNIQGDPKDIVVDEFLGMLLCLMISGTHNFTVILILFVIFRIIDNLKIPPFHLLERVGGASGILWDDIGIGLFIGLVSNLFF